MVFPPFPTIWPANNFLDYRSNCCIPGTVSAHHWHPQRTFQPDGVATVSASLQGSAVATPAGLVLYTRGGKNASKQRCLILEMLWHIQSKTMQRLLPATAIRKLMLLTLSFITNKLLEISRELTNFWFKWETAAQGVWDTWTESREHQVPAEPLNHSSTPALLQRPNYRKKLKLHDKNYEVGNLERAFVEFFLLMLLWVGWQKCPWPCLF